MRVLDGQDSNAVVSELVNDHKRKRLDEGNPSCREDDRSLPRTASDAIQGPVDFLDEAVPQAGAEPVIIGGRFDQFPGRLFEKNDRMIHPCRASRRDLTSSHETPAFGSLRYCSIRPSISTR